MISSLKRSLKCRQIGMTEMQISVNGTAGTPVASGPDAAFISSVVDNGTGNYTINFIEAAKIAPFVSGLVMLTDDVAATISAVTVSSITVSIRTIADAPAAADGDFNITWKFMDQLSYYF